MKLKVIEEEKDKLQIEIDESITFINLMNENVWKQNVDMSAYKIEHPYLSKPVMVVRAKNPKKALADAADQIISDVNSLRKQIAKK